MVNVLGLLTERGIGSCAEWEDRVRAAGSRDNFENNPSEEGRRSDRGHRDSTLGPLGIQVVGQRTSTYHSTGVWVSVRGRGVCVGMKWMLD